jgi:transcription antitermination factor NusG
MMWCAAQLDAGHIPYAIYCLGKLGFETYAPRLRTFRMNHGRKVEYRSLLFPSYVFVRIEAQWHAARRSPYVVRLVLAAPDAPARVPDVVIDELRAREREGAIDATPPPALQAYRSGDAIRIERGPFEGVAALFHEHINGHGRVAVLLQLLGGSRVELAVADIAPAAPDDDSGVYHRRHVHRGRRRPGKKQREATKMAGAVAK